jgi:hypothetical protein
MNTVLTYHSTIENFSSFILRSFWMIIAQNLQPSNAGSGKTFIIAKAIDIIHTNHKKLMNQRFSNITCPTFTIATGQDSEFIACFHSQSAINHQILAILSIVRFHSALIS